MSIRHALLVIMTTVLFAVPAGFAQNPIPNPGFEDWSAGEPVNWITSNFLAAGGVTESGDAHSGNSAARLEPVAFAPGVFFPAYVQSEGGIPVSERITALRGFSKFNPVGGDFFIAEVILLAGQEFIAAGYYTDSIASSGYEEFVIDIEYFIDIDPDTALITITISNEAEALNSGTWLLVDDLEFVADSGGASCPVVLTGDANLTGDVITSDIIYLVNYVLKGGPAPLPCVAAGDVNCDGQVVTSDAIYLVNYVLKGGSMPCDVCGLVPSTWTCP